MAASCCTPLGILKVVKGEEAAAWTDFFYGYSGYVPHDEEIPELHAFNVWLMPTHVPCSWCQ